MEVNQTRQDHDLLIRIDQKIENLLLEFAAMKKWQSTQHSDHEMRIRRLEYWGAVAIGGLFIVELALGVLIAFFT